MQTGILGCLVLHYLIGAIGVSHDSDIINQKPHITILKDFVSDFAESKAENMSNVSASQSEKCGEVRLPGIFLHPLNRYDSILEYNVSKEIWQGKKDNVFLLFRIGMRDGIPWQTNTNIPNGARFLVKMNGETVFSEDIADSVWKARTIDMRNWLDGYVKIEFRTNAIDGNTNYDWCVFGQPILVSIVPENRPATLSQDTVGIAIVEISCSKTADVKLTMGKVSESVRLDQGRHLLPLHFTEIAPITLDVKNGKAEITSTMIAPHTPKLELASLSLDSPLVTTDKPFKVILKLKNSGLGIYHGGGTATLNVLKDISKSSQERLAEIPLSIPEIAPGKEKSLIWDGLTAEASGKWKLIASLTETEIRSLSFHAFPSEPKTSSQHTKKPNVIVDPDKQIKAVVSNEWSRLNIVVDDTSDGYAIAEIWNGNEWQRVGSLYPLAYVSVSNKNGHRETPKLKIDSLENSDGKLVIKASAGNELMMNITYSPETESPIINIKHELRTKNDADINAFYGASMLAGDRSCGVKKDFAIFPGLEYLEGDEESSSERDLAYPLNIREVPAEYKITTPLMAVQAQDSLVALMWKADYEWADGEKYPSARFLVQSNKTGYSHIPMSLFAPSVGEYVKENSYEADKPYHLKKGKSIKLDAYLVLDHKKRYTDDSIVNGKHKGGLVLKAIQHWFDVYGFPEPSKQPRSWDLEKALCRDAYLNAVWSEDPPGWRHCHGWQPSLSVGHAVPLTLELRDGVSPDVQKEIDRRISLVLNRAIESQGKGYLWSNAGCHIMLGELPFYYGHLADALKSFRTNAYHRLESRENGLWVWHPQDKEHEALGVPGDHTLGQVALNSFMILRAARFTGDPELIRQALDAMKQMELYEIPRGAQMWECPLYQPDILASAYAIRAYCEAYRLTGKTDYLEQAKYWGLTGLPFLYMWELEGHPTMQYNVISVIGSTFYTHSWIGLPVVWCGLVYAYGLLDLAEFDESFNWHKVAQGIVNSTMWQQYTDGPSKGCYPDSWNMIQNKPNPADINPENILVNEFRLRGLSPEPRCVRFRNGDGFSFLNSPADILNPSGDINKGTISFKLSGVSGFSVYSILAPVAKPVSVNDINQTNSADFQNVSDGWFYDDDLKAILIKTKIKPEGVEYNIHF